MKPMEPMKPMAAPERWWPQDFGEPTSSGSQNEWRYAFFAKRQRLLIDQNGKVVTYDSGSHAIDAVLQVSGARGLTFSTADGPVALDELQQL